MPQQPIHTTEDYVQLFHQGNERGLAYLFEKLYPLMVYYANELVNDKTLAEEVAATAFVKAWRHHEQLNSFAGIKSYILKIVGRDSKRAGATEVKRRSLHQLQHSETIIPETAFNRIVKAETYNILHQAIKQLAPGMRAVMESIYIEGNTLTETAQLLGISVGAAGIQKKRGVYKLSKILPRFGCHLLIIVTLNLVRAWVA